MKSDYKFVPTKVHLRWLEVCPAWTRCGHLVAWRLYTDDIEDVDCGRCLNLIGLAKAREARVAAQGGA